MKMQKRAAAKPEIVRYVSHKREECEKLRGLGLRERWLYMELKWIANFSTGVGGRFFSQRLTYEKLATLVAVPASQGRAADTIDRTEAWRLMQRLEATGLVSEIVERDDNGGLTYKLPLSPIAPSERLQQAGTPKKPTTPYSEQVSGHQAIPPSVLISHKSINTPITTGGAAANSAFVGAADENQPPLPENPNPAPQALTLPAIEQHLSAAHFDYVASSQSRRFYGRWIAKGITMEQLARAVEKVADDFTQHQTANSVDEVLRNWHKRQSGRGRVAL